MKAIDRISRHGWYVIPQMIPAIARAAAGIDEHASIKMNGLRPESDFFGQPIQKMEVKNSVAIIPIKGTMLKGAEPIDKMFGFISHEDIAEDLMSAAKQSPKAIVLDVNSPGGSAMGTPELASLVASTANSVPVFAFTTDLMASAAYYASAGATLISGSPSSIIGSIGSIATHIDLSGMLAQAGISVEQFASGKYKGMGSPLVSLTDEQRDFMQDWVDDSGNSFKDYVLENRPDVSPESLQGQWFSGSQASEIGLSDATFNSLDEFLEQILG